MTDLTKLNAETGFQSKYRFKIWSKCAKIHSKLKELLMGTIPVSYYTYHGKLPLDTFWKKTALVSKENKECKNSSQELKKSEIVEIEIRKIIKKITGNNNDYDSLTYDEYQNLIREYCSSKKLEENSKTEEILVWVYGCYIVARMVESLDDPAYWEKLSPSHRRMYLDYGHQLIENCQQSSDKYWKVVVNTLRDRIQFLYFLKLSITYGVDFNKLLSYDRENLVKYAKKIFSYLNEDTYFFQESQIISYIDPFEPAVPWEDWDVSE
jgi:hypothetical protein